MDFYRRSGFLRDLHGRYVCILEDPATSSTRAIDGLEPSLPCIFSSTKASCFPCSWKIQAPSMLKVGAVSFHHKKSSTPLLPFHYIPNSASQDVCTQIFCRSCHCSFLQCRASINQACNARKAPGSFLGLGQSGSN
jgi:hypothetical protein